jgi:hypothetical protein
LRIAVGFDAGHPKIRASLARSQISICVFAMYLVGQTAVGTICSSTSMFGTGLCEIDVHHKRGIVKYEMWDFLLTLLYFESPKTRARIPSCTARPGNDAALLE